MQKDWNSFWVGHGQGASLAEAPVDAPSLDQAWQDYFKPFSDLPEKSVKIADLACGAGIVAEAARDVVGAAAYLTCLDYAPAAIETLAQKGVVDEALVGDAAALPFPNQSFDIVCSQFGIEYAGPKAFSEAARVTAAGGRLRIVAHLYKGAIWGECEANGRAVGGVLESGIFEAALLTFTTLGQIRRGSADQSALSRPHREVSAAVPAIQEVIDKAPQGSAGKEFVERLYADFSRVFSRLNAFEPQELLNWAHAMKTETQAYQARMTSMTAASLDEHSSKASVELMTAQGLVMEPPTIIEDGKEPVAWLFEGRRPV